MIKITFKGKEYWLTKEDIALIERVCNAVIRV